LRKCRFLTLFWDVVGVVLVQVETGFQGPRKSTLRRVMQTLLCRYVS
jgi:hypothetical protein